MEESELVDWIGIGMRVSGERRRKGLTQAALASRCGLSQAQISYIESSRRRPDLEHLIKICSVLDLPVNRLLNGWYWQGGSLVELAVELKALGVVDLWVEGAKVPGSFRRPEEVVAIAMSPANPNPRVVEAIPAVLAWNEWSPALLKAFADRHGSTYRVAWLADIALAIEKSGGFPGGCNTEGLTIYVGDVEDAGDRRSLEWDSLSLNSTGLPGSPIWKRWKIVYEADLTAFKDRAVGLTELDAKPLIPAKGFKGGRGRYGEGQDP